MPVRQWLNSELHCDELHCHQRAWFYLCARRSLDLLKETVEVAPGQWWTWDAHAVQGVPKTLELSLIVLLAQFEQQIADMSRLHPVDWT